MLNVIDSGQVTQTGMSSNHKHTLRPRVVNFFLNRHAHIASADSNHSSRPAVISRRLAKRYYEKKAVFLYTVFIT